MSDTTGESNATDSGPGDPPDLGRTTKPRRWPWLVAVLVVLVIGALVASNVVLWLRLNDTRSDLTRSRQVSRADATVAVDLNDRVNTLESDIGDLQDNGATSDDIDTLQTNVDDLASCVDDYMDTVALAGGGRYVYNHC